MSDQTCRHCGVPIVLVAIGEWWHEQRGGGTLRSYRACRDKAGKLTGRGHAEPEEKA
ncbi:hypothetical protein [Mycolicibacterium llatzerense]|uniref:hypothetical protein n=1 Tax=Mycolicibacterium llatzerense TaxID=280871 RepID=UPI0021B54F90|nr:hypothetical protein [Mycolicibacterium llatzerense]